MNNKSFDNSIIILLLYDEIKYSNMLSKIKTKYIFNAKAAF